MSVSVLLPSRENAAGFKAVCENLSALAGDTDEFEIVLMVDSDDPQGAEYRNIIRSNSLGIVLCENSTIKGYGNLHLMFDECARHASGDVLLAYNDDVICETPGWDDLYLRSAMENPLLPICHEIKGDHFRWAFPAISRTVYNRIGQFCPENIPSFDRVWAAVGDVVGHSQSGVAFNHKRIAVDAGREDRKKFCQDAADNWDSRMALWTEAGKRIAEKLK
jgi:hypothetical protein